MPRTLVTIEAVHNGQVLDWTWRRVTVDMDRRALGQVQIGQAIMQIVDDMRLRGWSASSKAGVRFQVELMDQTQ